jgi:hypothetical protein
MSGGVRSKSELNQDVSIAIPSFVFRDRSVAVMESLVEFLKDQKGFSIQEIAILLNRNQRTIWTVYHRAKIKRRKHY